MPIAASAAPPPRAAKPKPSPVKHDPRTAERADALTGIAQLAQIGLVGARQYSDAGAVGLHGPGICRELANLAETVPQIAQLTDLLIKAGPYTALVSAVMPLAAQIAVNHKRAPAGILGTVSGDMLEAQIRTQIMRDEADMLRMQQEAERESAALRAELEEMTAKADGKGPE